MEKSKALQTSNSQENSAPPNQLYSKCQRNFSKWETQENKRTYKNKPITIKKMVIGTYISIITLNVNGLNSPTKRHRLLNGYKNKTYTYAVYKRSTSDLATHTD